MRTVALALSIVVLLGTPALAKHVVALQAGGSDGAGDGNESGIGFNKKIFIPWLAAVDLGFTGFHAGWALTGHRPQRSVAGLQVAVSTTTFIFGANIIKAGEHDPLVIAGTAWSGLLIAHSIWILAHPAEEPKALPLNVSIGQGMVGVDYGGSF